VFIEQLQICKNDYIKKKNWVDKRWDGLTIHAASIVHDQMEKERLVIASEWDLVSLTFYVKCPNDIHRHSSLHGEKVQKIAEKKLEELEAANEDDTNKKAPNEASIKGFSKSHIAELLKEIASEEKEQAGSLQEGGSLSKAVLCIPEFVSAFKVSISTRSDGEWYLGCSCTKFGKR
jgi:hypothetical protein